MIACTKRRLHPDPPLGAGSALPVVHSSPGLLSPLDAPTVSGGDCERFGLGAFAPYQIRCRMLRVQTLAVLLVCSLASLLRPTRQCSAHRVALQCHLPKRDRQEPEAPRASLFPNTARGRVLHAGPLLCLRGGGDHWNNNYQPPQDHGQSPPPTVYGQYGRGRGGYGSYGRGGPGGGGDDAGSYNAYSHGARDGQDVGHGGEWQERGPWERAGGWGQGRGRGGGYDNFRAGGYEVLQDGYGSYYGGRGGRGEYRSRGYLGRGRGGRGAAYRGDYRGRGAVYRGRGAGYSAYPPPPTLEPHQLPPVASTGGALGMLGMLQEDTGVQGGLVGGSAYGQYGGGDAGNSRYGQSKRGAYPTSAQGYSTRGEGWAVGADGVDEGLGAIAMKRRGGDLSSPQVQKKLTAGAYAAGWKGANGSGEEQGVGVPSPVKRELFASGVQGHERRIESVAAAGEGAADEDSGRDAEEMYERKMKALKHRDPDTVEVISEPEAREREHYWLQQRYMKQMPEVLVKLSLGQQRTIAESNPQRHRQLSPQASELVGLASNVFDTISKYDHLGAGSAGGGDAQGRAGALEGEVSGQAGVRDGRRGGCEGKRQGDSGDGLKYTWEHNYLSDEEIDFADGERFFRPYEPLELQLGREAVAYWERHKWDDYRSPIYDRPEILRNDSRRAAMEKDMDDELQEVAKVLLYKTLPERGREGEYVDGVLQIDTRVAREMVEALDSLQNASGQAGDTTSDVCGTVLSVETGVATAEEGVEEARGECATAGKGRRGRPPTPRAGTPQDVEGDTVVKSLTPSLQQDGPSRESTGKAMGGGGGDGTVAVRSELNKLFIKSLLTQQPWVDVFDRIVPVSRGSDGAAGRGDARDDARIQDIICELARVGVCGLDEEADVPCRELACQMSDSFDDGTGDAPFFGDPSGSLNRLDSFWENGEPEDKWRNPSPPAQHRSTPNGPLPALLPDSTPAGGAYMAGGAGVGGSGGGIPSAGSVGDGPTPLHRLVDDGLRPGGGGGDNLQLVEIAQRLGISLKYSEPPERAIATKQWVVYEYEGSPLRLMRNIPVSECSYYLFGRDDSLEQLLQQKFICLAEQTVSGQHAVLQFRKHAESSSHLVVLREGMTELDEDPDGGNPYMIDLSSTNGSYLNGERMEAGVFYRLKEGDSLRFAHGHREYRLLQQR